MPITEKELLTGVLRETLNLDDAGVASLYNEDGTIKDDAQTTILQLDADRVKNLKTGSTKTSFDDGYKKAQSEIATKFENDFKTKTGFKSEKKGIELVLEYAKTQTSAGEITDDLIKKHPIYLTMQEQKDAEIQTALADGEKKLSGFQTELSKKETFSKVASKALELFHSLKPVLSKDAAKIKASEQIILNDLSKYDWEIQGDRFVPLKDGKILETANGNPIAFDKLVKDSTNFYFDVHAIDPKQSAGNQKSDANKQVFNFEVPKTDAEYTKMVSDSSKSIEERQAIKEAYMKSKQTS